MKSFLFTSTPSPIRSSPSPSPSPSPYLPLSRISLNRVLFSTKTCCGFIPIRFSKPSISEDYLDSEFSRAPINLLEDKSFNNYNVHVGSPLSPYSIHPLAKLSLSDQAFLLLTFIACTTSVAFTSLVVTAIPTLMAMARAATSFAKLADKACQELPCTLEAIRLSGMEISDLTLELSELSQEISDGVNKSAKAVQAAKAGIQQVGTLAQQQTISMIEERASLPVISLQPVVVGAAEKTSLTVRRATKRLLNIISGGDRDEDNVGVDSLDL